MEGTEGIENGEEGVQHVLPVRSGNMTGQVSAGIEGAWDIVCASFAVIFFFMF